MSDNRITDDQRRRFVRISLISLALAPVGNLFLHRDAAARGSRGITGEHAEIAKLPENDKQAMALAYTANADSVDTSKYKRVEGAMCRNCQLYSGSEKDEWGPCAIFSYRVHPHLNRSYVVSAQGWCRSWAPRAG